MKSLEGRVAAVTGAASGIGRALAVELARERCDVAISDVDEAGLAETRNLAEALGVEVTSRRLDVSDREGVFAWADEVVAQHGRANMIFNNAGVALSGRLRDVTFEEFEWLMDIDFWGVVNGTKAFLPHLERSGEGHVVNVSSVFGLIAFPGNGTYNAAKFAVRGFTEALSIELEMDGSCVSASCVHPGGIRTNIARNMRPSEKSERPPDPEAAAVEFDRAARTSSEQAARDILNGVKRNQRRILVGRDARLISAVQRLLPRAYQRLLSRFVPSDSPLV